MFGSLYCDQADGFCGPSGRLTTKLGSIADPVAISDPRSRSPIPHTHTQHCFEKFQLTAPEKTSFERFIPMCSTGLLPLLSPILSHCSVGLPVADVYWRFRYRHLTPEVYLKVPGCLQG